MQMGALAIVITIRIAYTVYTHAFPDRDAEWPDLRHANDALLKHFSYINSTLHTPYIHM